MTDCSIEEECRNCWLTPVFQAGGDLHSPWWLKGVTSQREIMLEILLCLASLYAFGCGCVCGGLVVYFRNDTHRALLGKRKINEESTATDDFPIMIHQKSLHFPEKSIIQNTASASISTIIASR